MKGFDPAASFGPDIADAYDDKVRGDEEVAAVFLSELARGGRVLEFAIGTGRIALPLVERGLEVDGIELSPAMVKRLRAKPGGAELTVTIGDMSVAEMHTQYRLVYLVFNTIFNLVTAEDQIRCFENAAKHLTDSGVFVVETAVPHAWVAPGESGYVRAEHVGLNEVVLDVARYDPASQLLEENHVSLTAGGVAMTPIVCRLITPGEMDLMARMAGLSLIDRFGSWRREPFSPDSRGHVSVYGKG